MLTSYIRAAMHRAAYKILDDARSMAISLDSTGYGPMLRRSKPAATSWKRYSKNGSY